jgi:hypothetical protein
MSSMVARLKSENYSGNLRIRFEQKLDVCRGCCKGSIALHIFDMHRSEDVQQNEEDCRCKESLACCKVRA